MEPVITYETLRYFAYSSDRLVAGGIRGVILEFKGLNGCQMAEEDPEWALRLAEKNIALVIPYLNPWNWMNRETVETTEEILRALREGRDLPESIPVVATGGSMGGLCALVYTRYAKVTPVACAVNCPVCDLPFHYTERPDLPHTLYSAFWHEEGGLEAAMKAHSPLHLAAEMPDIPYALFHCEEDRAVNIHSHSDRFVAAMRPGHRIEYHTVPGRDHCQLDEKTLALYRLRAEQAITGKE